MASATAFSRAMLCSSFNSDRWFCFSTSTNVSGPFNWFRYFRLVSISANCVIFTVIWLVTGLMSFDSFLVILTTQHWLTRKTVIKWANNVSECRCAEHLQLVARKAHVTQELLQQRGRLHRNAEELLQFKIHSVAIRLSCWNQPNLLRVKLRW